VRSRCQRVVLARLIRRRGPHAGGKHSSKPGTYQGLTRGFPPVTGLPEEPDGHLVDTTLHDISCTQPSAPLTPISTKTHEPLAVQNDDNGHGMNRQYSLRTKVTLTPGASRCYNNAQPGIYRGSHGQSSHRASFGSLSKHVTTRGVPRTGAARLASAPCPAAAWPSPSRMYIWRQDGTAHHGAWLMSRHVTRDRMLTRR
jgi:hypothetical protein